MKAEDIDAVEAREYARLTGIPRLVAALRDAQAEVAHLRGEGRESNGCREMRDQRDADTARAEKAEAQVAAVLALCDEWEAGPWSWLKTTAAPRVRAAVDGAGATQANDGAS